MAKVMFARLSREIRKDPQTGSYSLVGRFSQLRLSKGPVRFVCVVYWEPGEETFRHSLVLRDEAGNVLDETPATECVLTKQGKNISTAFFYASFSNAGHYGIEVYQDGICIATIPLEVIDPWKIFKNPSASLASLESSVPRLMPAIASPAPRKTPPK